MAEGIASLARDIYMPEGFFGNLMTTDDSIRRDMQSLRQQDPVGFQQMMDANTEANIARLNRLQFEQDEMVSGSPIPGVDRYLSDQAVYSTQVPPGFENVQYLERDRNTAGVNIPSRPTGLTERTFVPGTASDQVMLHEAAHAALPKENTLDAFLGTEEKAVTGMDLYRAFKSDNPNEFTSSINYLAEQGVNMFYPPDLARLKDNIVQNIVTLSQQAGAPMSVERVQELDSDVQKTVVAAGRKAQRLYEESRPTAQGYANGGGVQSLAPVARNMFRR